MAEAEGLYPSTSSVRFSWSSVKIPEYKGERDHRHLNAVRFTLPPFLAKLPPFLAKLEKARVLAMDFVGSLKNRKTPLKRSSSSRRRMPLLCSASLSAPNGEYEASFELENAQHSSQEGLRSMVPVPKGSQGKEEEELKVLVKEVLIQKKNGEELENPEQRSAAMGALKLSRANAILSVQDVQDEVHRIVQSGYFVSCKPDVVCLAPNPRDGIRLTFKVEPNEEFRGLICEGANVLPTKIVEDAFKDEYGKVVNFQHLDEVLKSVDRWYGERGIFAGISDIKILSGGIVGLQVTEAEVNNITIQFLDKKTGEPTVGKTLPETLLRQLTTKRGQVYSLQQKKMDEEIVRSMDIMEDVNIVACPAGDTGKVDLTMNVVERAKGEFGAGGGFSRSGTTGGILSGLIGSFTYSHKNVFGRNQKLNISLNRGQIDSLFNISYTDPWIEGDDKRTSRSISLQNSRAPGTLIHGSGSPVPSHCGVTLGRLMARVDYGRPFRPKWSGGAGISFQHAGARDHNGHPIVKDEFQAPLTFSGKEYDDMILARLEAVYADSGGQGSSMVVFNMEQGLPVFPNLLNFNRVNVRARQEKYFGPVRCIASFSGGNVLGDLAPYDAFPIGGTNSVRGYEEGAVGSGRSVFVANGEISVPMYGAVEGAIFADYGTDFGSGQTVPGNPAGFRGKPGSGYGYGVGIRIPSPVGPLRLDFAQNNLQGRKFHFGFGSLHLN